MPPHYVLTTLFASTIVLATLLPGCVQQGNKAVSSSAETAIAQSVEGSSTPSSAQDGANSPSAARDKSESSNDGDEDSRNATSNFRAIARLIVGDCEFTVELADTPTARDFVAHLPLSLVFDELNGNEKFAYLNASLPTQPTNPGTIHKGDVMLFGDNCLVVFYDTFSTNYQYTRIGHIVDSDNLAVAVRELQVEMTFEAA